MVKQEYLVERQGKTFCLYAGLLDEAHQQGLKRISTTIIQIPHPDNGNVAICHAEVETEKGTFSGIGDASSGNVGKMIVPHIIRMSETRSKARALRDAVNIGVAAVEELGGEDGAPEPDNAGRHERAEPRHETPAEPPAASGGKDATASQIDTIQKLRHLLSMEEMAVDGLTSAEAGREITRLSKEYNAAKGSSRRSS